MNFFLVKEAAKVERKNLGNKKKLKRFHYII
jgi:hypothetical protein